MDLRKLVYLSAILLSIAAVFFGAGDKRADLWIPGLISLFVSLLVMYMSFKGQSLKIWIILLLDVFLVVALMNVMITGISEYLQFMLATPLFICIAATILCCLIAYSEIRLDRVMMSVFMLFLTLSVSNAFSYGVYYYALRYGVMDELQANFWLDCEFAFAFVMVIAVILVSFAYMKKKGILMVSNKDLLYQTQQECENACAE